MRSSSPGARRIRSPRPGRAPASIAGCPPRRLGESCRRADGQAAAECRGRSPRSSHRARADADRSAMSCMLQETCAHTPARCSRSAVASALAGASHCVSRASSSSRCRRRACGRGKARVARRGRLIQLARQRPPFRIVAHGQRQPAIRLSGGVHAVRRHGQVTVSRPHGRDPEARLNERIADHGAGHFARRQIDMLGAARAAALMQSRHRGDGRMHARGVIHDVAHFHRRAIGVAASSSRALPTRRTGARSRQSASPGRFGPRRTATAR